MQVKDSRSLDHCGIVIKHHMRQSIGLIHTHRMEEWRAPTSSFQQYEFTYNHTYLPNSVGLRL